MTRANLFLLGLVACEVAASGGAIGLKLAAPRPPLAEFSCVDSITAGELRQLAANVRTPEDWRKLGETYMATGFFRESEACHRVAAASHAANAEAVQQWAYALERLGALDAANAAYTRAAELDPARSANCSHMIACNKLRQEDVPAARREFANAGNLPAARYELARLLVRDGRHSEAVAVLTTLESEFPAAKEPPLLLHFIALLQRRSLEAEQAAGRLDATTDRLFSPFSSDRQRLEAAHDQMGLQRQWLEAHRLLEAGNSVAAERMFRDALAARFDAYPADWLAEALFQQGRAEEAAEVEAEITERLGPKVEYLERLGDTLDALGKKEEARAAWLRATQLSFGPPLRDVHGKLAESLAKAGQQQLANQHFAQAALSAGIAGFRAGQLRDAERALREAVRLDPQLAHAWYYLGEAASQRGDAEAARTAYERCLSIQPHHGRAADRLELLTQAANGQ